MLDNTACVPSFVLRIAARNSPDPPPLLCTMCATGDWHSQFPRMRYDPDTHGPLHPTLRTLLGSAA